MGDEPGDYDLLTEKQHAVLLAARLALVDAIERAIGDDKHQVVTLVFISVSGLFADMLTLSATHLAGDAAKFVDVINQQLAESGWRLVPVLRH